MIAPMNPLRWIILVMVGSAFWRRLLTGRRVTRRVVARFIPGESLDEALQAVRRINRDGMRASLNPLG